MKKNMMKVAREFIYKTVVAANIFLAMGRTVFASEGTSLLKRLFYGTPTEWAQSFGVAFTLLGIVELINIVDFGKNNVDRTKRLLKTGFAKVSIGCLLIAASTLG